MYKDILIQCLKTLPIGKGKIIVDVEDIKDVDGQGWDFTLKYRPLLNPFGMNEISFHNWITKETYNTFKEDYLKNEEQRNQKKEEIRIAREEMTAARLAYDDFMNANTTGEDNENNEPLFPGMVGLMDNPVPARTFTITTENVDEFRRLQDDLRFKQEVYNKKVSELNKL